MLVLEIECYRITASVSHLTGPLPPHQSIIWLAHCSHICQSFGLSSTTGITALPHQSVIWSHLIEILYSLIFVVCVSINCINLIRMLSKITFYIHTQMKFHSDKYCCITCCGTPCYGYSFLLAHWKDLDSLVCGLPPWGDIIFKSFYSGSNLQHIIVQISSLPLGFWINLLPK